MTVRLTVDGTIALEGSCPTEDAEQLQRYLLSNPAAKVDWRGCLTAHTAVIQIMLAFRPVVVGPPAGDLLRTHIGPLLAEKAP